MALTCKFKKGVMSSGACFVFFSLFLIIVMMENTGLFWFCCFTSLHFNRSPRRLLGVGEIEPVKVHRGGCRVFGNGTDELGDQVE